MGIRRAAEFVSLAGAALMVSAGTAWAAAEATGLPEDAVVGGYVPMKPTEGKGMPTDGAIGFQEQFSPIGEYGQWMHNLVLLPIIAAICLLVLFLLIWVMAKYRAKANPNPSRTSHNTFIEVLWTLLPVLILLGIAVPSMRLLANQYETAPEDALTVKVTGYQWYWGYTYPDQGGFEVISNMMPEDEAIANGEPAQLAVDNRMVVPANTPIRIQTIGADVIHSFAVPSLWFKLDAVPGRLNEKVMFIKEPGVYYGQCMELCGARHGYMPIAVEALPREQWEQWVLEQPGGTLGGDEEAALEVPSQEPESAVPGAAGAPRPDSALEDEFEDAAPATTEA